MLCYESMLADPQAAVRRIADFIGVSPDAALLHRLLHLPRVPDIEKGPDESAGALARVNCALARYALTTLGARCRSACDRMPAIRPH